MILINSSYEIIDQESGLEGIYKQIETGGRLCYATEPKGDPEAFVDMLIKRGHLAMLEHGTVYLEFNPVTDGFPMKYWRNPYSECVKIGGYSFVTTNLRVLVQNGWLDDLKYLCESTGYHAKRVTVLFHTDRITGESFLRHRSIDEDHNDLHDIDKVFSYARQSTRFCNFSKDRFGHQIMFVIPSIIDDIKEGEYEIEWDKGDPSCRELLNIDTCWTTKKWFYSCATHERDYFDLLDCGWTPEDARYVLGFSLYSPLLMTGFVSNWEHFFDLRATGITGTPHKDARNLALPLMKEFKSRGLLYEIAEEN